MPERAGLDDHPGLTELIGLWRDGSADLDSRLAAVWADVREEIRRVGLHSHRAYRLKLQADRLAELQQTAEHVLDDLLQSTDRFLATNQMGIIYSAGAQTAASTVGAFSFTAPHRAAVEALSVDTFQDVLGATRHVDRDAKAWVRRVSRQLTNAKITGGEPVKAQARRFERELAGEFQARGIGAVTYADGSRHSFGEYAEMLMRTKTAQAYNAGTLNHSRMAGIRYLEILDGSLCGLTAHHDPQLANGLIVPLHIAEAYPLSHPSCRRALAPRPDVSSSPFDGRQRSVVADESRRDQTAFEEALRRQSGSGGRRERRGRRSARDRRPRLSPRQRRREAARREAAEGNRRRRAEIDRARAEHARRRAGELAGERSAAAGGGRAPADVLDRFGVTADQWVNARAVVGDLRREVREVARREADELGSWLSTNSLDQLTRPARLRQTRDPVTGRTRRVRDQSGYDWLEQLSGPEDRRVRRRMADSDLFTPDLLGDQVRRVTGLDLSDDEAMDWLVEQWLREDGLRAIASGRVPKYADPDALLPAEQAMEGYRLGQIFGVDLDDAAGHVASVQADAARVYAERALGRPRFGPAPWEMDAGDYVRELEQLDDLLARAADPGADALPESVRLRLRELAPSDIDRDGSMAPMELFERIRLTAQMAGYEVP